MTTALLVGRSPAQIQAIARAARVAAARESFPDFLRHVRIRSDDPVAPGIVAFEPWPYQLEMADRWQAHESMVILKARQIGASTLLKAYCIWRAWAHDWHVGYWSRGDTEAVAWLAGADDEWGVQQMAESLPREFGVRVKRTGDHLSIGGGGIRVFPGTVAGGVGFTFQLIVADEAAHHPYGKDNYANYRPTLSAGAQYLCLSTSSPQQGPTGWFYEMWQAAVAGSTYSPVFLSWRARTDRDDAWLERERVASHGDTAAFGANYPERPTDAFMGREGLVHPQFEHGKHVVTEHPIRWDACTFRWAAYDLGGGDPTAIVFMGAWRNPATAFWHVHQFSEWYERRTLGIEDAMMALLPWRDLDFVVCDPREPSLCASLRGRGLRAGLADWSRKEGLAYQSEWLDNGRMTIHESCANSIAEFAGYRWAERTNPHSRERYDTSTPVDHHADAMDARRYALMWARQLLEPKVPARKALPIQLR